MATRLFLLIVIVAIVAISAAVLIGTTRGQRGKELNRNQRHQLQAQEVLINGLLRDAYQYRPVDEGGIAQVIIDRIEDYKTKELE